MSSEQGSLDRYLPVYRHREVHEVTVKAGPEGVMRAIRELKGRDVALTRPLFALRSLPAWLLRRPVRSSHPDQPVIDVILKGGFILLDEGPLEMAVGVIGGPNVTIGSVPLWQPLAGSWCVLTPVIAAWYFGTIAYGLYGGLLVAAGKDFSYPIFGRWARRRLVARES